MNRVDVFVNRRRVKTLETWTFRAILAEAFFLALSPSLAAAAVLFGTVTCFLRLQRDKRFKLRSLPFDIPAMIFALISLVSIFFSSSLNWELLYHYVSFVGIYGLTYILVGQNIRNREQVKLLVLALAASALLVVLRGYFQYVFGIDTLDMKWVDPEKFPELKKRVFSTLENPNVLAGYLDVFICLTLGILAKIGSRIQRVVLSLAIVMFAACLAMTYARGAYLTIIIVFIIYGIIQDWRILIFFLLVTGGILYCDAAFVDRLLSIFTATDSSEGLRIGIWISTLAMIADHPFIGIGWGAFKSVYPNYDYYLKGANVEIFHAHNIFLHYTAEIGIIGAMAFFWYFFGTMFMSLELGTNKKFNAIRQKLSAMFERISGIEFKRKLLKAKDEVKTRYLIENGRLERLVGMKERTADRVAEASDKFIDWISSSEEEELPEDGTVAAENVSRIKKVSLKKNNSVNIVENISDMRTVDNAIESDIEDKNIDSSAVEGGTIGGDDNNESDNNLFNFEGLTEIDNRQLTDGVKFGIGLAFVSMTLNGLADNLLFNIPTSMLMWMLGALGGAISLLPENENVKRRQSS